MFLHKPECLHLICNCKIKGHIVRYVITISRLKVTIMRNNAEIVIICYDLWEILLFSLLPSRANEILRVLRNKVDFFFFLLQVGNAMDFHNMDKNAKELEKFIWLLEVC